MKAIALVTFFISTIHSTENHVSSHEGKCRSSSVHIERYPVLLNTLLTLRCRRIRGGYLEDPSIEERKSIVRDMQNKVVLARNFKKAASDSREDSDFDGRPRLGSKQRKRERDQESSEGSEVSQGDYSWKQGERPDDVADASDLHGDEPAFEGSREPHGQIDNPRLAVPIEGDVVEWRGEGAFTPLHRSRPPFRRFYERFRVGRLRASASRMGISRCAESIT